MANIIPMRFKRITAAFDEVARARLYEPCSSSGSEHSAAENSGTDLSDLVDSFLERGDSDGGDQSSEERKKKMKKSTKKKKSEEDGDCSESESYGCTEAEMKEMLIGLIGGDSKKDCSLRRMICSEVNKAGRSLVNPSSEGFKRGIMAYLRQLGFDAGLCKSRWEKTGRHPAREYEYIDIIISKTRYIIEPSLTTELTIARPNKRYSALLETVPQILALKEAELKQLLRLMCNEMRLSLRNRDMHVPPWRRNGYMQSKWFGSYRRTTNAVATGQMTKRVGKLDGKCLIGFEPLPAAAAVLYSSYCRTEVVRKVRVDRGNLKGVFSDMPS